MAAQKRLTDKFEPEGDPELTAAMTEEDGDSLEVKYYSYDTNYYAAVVDEKVYLVNKMNLKNSLLLWIRWWHLRMRAQMSRKQRIQIQKIQRNKLLRIRQR